MAKKSEIERLAMSGLHVLGIATIIGIVVLVVWHFLIGPHMPSQPTAYVEGQTGLIQSATVTLQDGTKLRCFTFGFGSGESISCDWANATKVNS